MKCTIRLVTLCREKLQKLTSLFVILIRLIIINVLKVCFEVKQHRIGSVMMELNLESHKDSPRIYTSV